MGRRQKDDSGKGKLPSLLKRAEQAKDPDWIWEGMKRDYTRTFAKSLYHGFYSSLSSPSHGELWAAQMIVNRAEPAVMETMLDTAGHATWDLLAGLTEPLELKDARAVLMDGADGLAR